MIKMQIDSLEAFIEEFEIKFHHENDIGNILVVNMYNGLLRDKTELLRIGYPIKNMSAIIPMVAKGVNKNVTPYFFNIFKPNILANFGDSIDNIMEYYVKNLGRAQGGGNLEVIINIDYNDIKDLASSSNMTKYHMVDIYGNTNELRRNVYINRKILINTPVLLAARDFHDAPTLENYKVFEDKVSATRMQILGRVINEIEKCLSEKVYNELKSYSESLISNGTTL